MRIVIGRGNNRRVSAHQSEVMQRKTKMHPYAWIAHHRLQYGPNWRFVAKRYFDERSH